MNLHIQVLLLAVAMDILFGEMPGTIHPVVWLGALIRQTSRICERMRWKYVSGLMLVLICVSCALVVGVLLTHITAHLPITGLFMMAYFLKSTFSIRSLISSSNLIYKDLSANDHKSARKDLISLVSRDTTTLDSHRIASAAIESTAENFVDGILSPVLYYALFGISGALVYKAINTLDSMVGYKNERFRKIGFVSARLDDIVNWIPARLSVFVILIASVPYSPVSALKTCIRDHTYPASPNSGFPMAAIAGALSCRLEKPGSYVLGSEYPEPDPQQILQANRIVLIASFILIVAVLMGLLLPI